MRIAFRPTMDSLILEVTSGDSDNEGIMDSESRQLPDLRRLLGRDIAVHSSSRKYSGGCGASSSSGGRALEPKP
jgi:mevalonate pyrophosphate decarboxylase